MLKKTEPKKTTVTGKFLAILVCSTALAIACFVFLYRHRDPAYIFLYEQGLINHDRTDWIEEFLARAGEIVIDPDDEEGMRRVDELFDLRDYYSGIIIYDHDTEFSRLHDLFTICIYQDEVFGHDREVYGFALSRFQMYAFESPEILLICRGGADDIVYVHLDYFIACHISGVRYRAVDCHISGLCMHAVYLHVTVSERRIRQPVAEAVE